ncbi:MAG: PqqD family peptide modification chaperone [Caldithrix sp.]|nr:PqqD family peptide modification chaperone [Caldithrix sp.]
MPMKPETINQLLVCYPRRNCDWEMDEENDLIIILRPKFRNRVAKKLFDPLMKTKHFKIKLDKIGTLVWTHCDGNTTVEKIGTEMRKAFGEDLNQIYERLSKFLLQLQREKFIDIYCPSDGSER